MMYPVVVGLLAMLAIALAFNLLTVPAFRADLKSVFALLASAAFFVAIAYWIGVLVLWLIHLVRT